MGGRFGRQIKSHRASWLLHNGDIRPGLFVCHRCDNPPCVNPDHLFLGTHQDNAADRAAKGRSALCGVRGGHYRAVLDVETVRRVRSLYQGGLRQCDIARQVGIPSQQVYKVVTRASWRHVA